MAKKIQIDLQARTDKANRDIKAFADKSKSNFNKVKRSSASASKSMMAGWKKAAIAVAGVTAGIVAVVAAVKVAKRAFTAFTEVAKVGDDFHKMSLRIGETTEELSALGYAADISGASIDVVEKALKYLVTQMEDFKTGTGEAKDTFEALGITVTTTDGKLKSSITVLKEAADKISKMEGASDQLAASINLFGQRAGPQLLPMLKLGERGIEELMKKAEELRLVISTEFAGKSAAFIDSMRDWKGAMDGIKNVIVESLLPAITDIVEGTTNWIKANKEFIQVDLKNYIVGIVEALKGYISTVKGLKAIWDKFHPGDRIEEIAGRAVGNLLKKAGEEVEDTFKGSEDQIWNTIKALKDFEKETAGIKFPPAFFDMGVKVKVDWEKGTLDLVELMTIKETMIMLEGLIHLRRIQRKELQNTLKIQEKLLKTAKWKRITTLWDPKVIKEVKALSAAINKTKKDLEKLEKPINLNKWLLKGVENIKSYVKGQKEVTLSTEEYIKRAKEMAAIEYAPPFDWEEWIPPVKIFEMYDKISKAAVDSATDATFAMHDLMKEVEQGMKDTAAGVERIKQKELDVFIGNIDKILEAERKKSEEIGVLYMQEQMWKEESWEKTAQASKEAAEKAAAPWIELGNIIQYNMENLAVSAMDNFITRIAEGGNAARQLQFLVGDMAKSICLDITRMIAKMLILKAIQTDWMGWLGRLGGGSVGGGTSVPAGSGNTPSFAGGGVATGPQSGYLAKLHGTELITPLNKGSKAAVSTNIVNNITVNVKGGGSEKDNQKTGSKVATLIGNEVDKRIARQLKPGGILSRNTAGGR
jgi:hypothetical protein